MKKVLLIVLISCFVPILSMAQDYLSFGAGYTMMMQVDPEFKDVYTGIGFNIIAFKALGSLSFGTPGFYYNGSIFATKVTYVEGKNEFLGAQFQGGLGIRGRLSRFLLFLVGIGPQLNSLSIGDLKYGGPILNYGVGATIELSCSLTNVIHLSAGLQGGYMFAIPIDEESAFKGGIIISPSLSIGLGAL